MTPVQRSNRMVIANRQNRTSKLQARDRGDFVARPGYHLPRKLVAYARSTPAFDHHVGAYWNRGVERGAKRL
jgi:hypothetical protein